MLLVLSVLFISFIVTTNAIQDPCPPESLLQPCTCSFTGVETVLRCGNLPKQTSLNKALRSGHRFDRVELTDSKIVSFPGKSLETNRFNYLKIARSSMVQLFYFRPRLDNELETLILEDVSLWGEIDWYQFENLQNVTRMSMRDVNVPELDDEFRNLASRRIKFIALKRTNTSRLDEMAFSGMPELLDVRIQENRIKKLKRSMFPYNSRMETFLFDDNEIDSLPDDMFINMPKLLRIGLRNNNISQISELVFEYVYKKLIVLLLEGNPINCDCSIKWLTAKDHHGKYVTGTCAQPPHLAGREITDLTTDLFAHCPGEDYNWQT